MTATDKLPPPSNDEERVAVLVIELCGKPGMTQADKAKVLGKALGTLGRCFAHVAGWKAAEEAFRRAAEVAREQVN